MNQGSDPLAKWRGQQPPETTVDTKLYSQIAKSASIDNPSGTPEGYEAFSVAEGRRPERLIIRRFTGDSHAPAYRYLMDVSTDGKYGTQIVLYYSFMQVRIEGRNMQAGVEALREGNCVSIQEHHVMEYPQPVKDDAPFIEKINIFIGTEAERARHEDKGQEPAIVLEMDKARSEIRGGGQDGGMKR